MRVEFLLLAPALLLLTGCVIDGRHLGPVQYSSETLEMDDTELLHMDLHMGAGELRVVDGGAKLMRADFAYSIPDWKPTVQYSRSGKQSTLSIEQPGKTHTVGNMRYTWELQVNKKVPVELAVHFGAGQAKLDLGSLDLRGLSVKMGVGEIDVDLRGVPKHSYDVTIHGGIGQATVRVSPDAAVSAEAHGGIGSINVQGLEHQGSHWVSHSWEGATNRIHIGVEGGIGEVRIIAD